MKVLKKQGTVYLSKSLFIRGLQCHKSLYLHKFKPELKDEISDEQEALFESGSEVGIIAQGLFPGGVEIPYEENNYAGQVEKTKAEIKKGAKIIYEAAFSHDNLFVKVDLLKKGKRGWEIYEVKSSTKVEDVHINDTAVQYYALKGNRLKVATAAVVHINNKYVRKGVIEPDKLFTIADVTPEVTKKQRFVKAELTKLQNMLCDNMPGVDIGKHCDSPYPCDFKGYCWQHIPDDSVFAIKRKGVDKFALYRQGIVEMKDVPLDILNKKQCIQVKSFIRKEEIIDKAAIKAFLKTLWYPMYFLDFETVYTPVPLFDGLRPYQQLPFQYSLHSLSKAGAKLKHSEFLAMPGVDPGKGLIEGLLADIPSDACIIAYTSFEASRINELGERFPEHKEALERLIKNIRDLSKPFNSMDYYHWQFYGSFSLKAVLPQLVPELSYEGLDIRHGGMAVEAYLQMANSKDRAETKKIRQALLEYCKLDTLAMVKVLEKLREISASVARCQ